jgi:hypothetical protein
VNTKRDEIRGPISINDDNPPPSNNFNNIETGEEGGRKGRGRQGEGGVKVL